MRTSIVLMLITLASGGAALAAFKLGGPTDFTTRGTQPGLTHPIISSQDCGNCHQATPEVAPNNTWEGSMMANAARDPLFWAALDVANADLPGVGDYCLRCHAPRAWLSGRAGKNLMGQPQAGGELGCLLEGSIDQPGGDFEGVGCHTCHRLVPEGPMQQPSPNENAAFWLDDGDCGGFGEPCRYGPYDYTDGAFPPPHAYAYSVFHERSESCASCHNVTTPYTDQGPARTLIDAQGVDTGIPMPIERTYDEWLVSDWADVVFHDRFEDPNDAFFVAEGQQCQGCHMPDAQEPQAFACTFGDNRSGNLPKHEFVGANIWVPDVLRQTYTDLGREPAFLATIANTRAMLQSAAEVRLVAATLDGNTLTFSTEIENRAGHKLPTGYLEGRRMWLAARVLDNGSNERWSIGQFDAADGSVSGESGDLVVFESKQGEWNAQTQTCETEDNGSPQFHFVLNNCIVKDNRIPPAGFRGGDDIETASVPANLYPEVQPGVRDNVATVEYVAELPQGTVAPLTIEVELLHQIASADYMAFLRDEAVDQSFPAEDDLCGGANNNPGGAGAMTRGEYAYQLWETYGLSPPELLDQATLAGVN